MHSNLRISEKQLRQYVQVILGNNQVELGKWSYSPLKWNPSNFVTGGLYRVKGEAKVRDKSLYWSLILKVIIPSSAANDPSHYNYWKREISAYQSGVLSQLPPMIRAPRCLGVETQDDNTVWLWLDEVSDHLQGQWSQTEYEKIARLLGNFNGTYLVSKEMPTDPWLCRDWLGSWVKECDRYDDGKALIEETWRETHLNKLFPPDIFIRYREFYKSRKQLLETLRKLPKVFTHNDAWAPNLFLQKDGSVIAVDWAFTGIAGVGEELGRFYGLCLHSGLGTTIDINRLSGILFDNYCLGLFEAGWKGDIRLVRFGFTASVGIRCGMLIPKIIDHFYRNKEDVNLTEQIQGRAKVASHLLELAEEAISLCRNLEL